LRDVLTNGQVFIGKKQVCMNGNGVCFVELLPRLPPGAWAIETRILQTRASHPGALIGLYAASSQRRTGDATKYAFVSVDHCEAIQVATKAKTASLARVRFWYFLDVRNQPPLNDATLQLPNELKLEKGPRFRTVRMEVREGQFIAICDGELIEKFSAAEIERSWPKLPANVGATGEGPVNPLGGLGLLVRDGELVIESFTVGPL
jgi:hypothetical protein